MDDDSVARHAAQWMDFPMVWPDIDRLRETDPDAAFHDALLSPNLRDADLGTDAPRIPFD